MPEIVFFFYREFLSPNHRINNKIVFDWINYKNIQEKKSIYFFFAFIKEKLEGIKNNFSPYLYLL